jgi:hypothetical protein
MFVTLFGHIVSLENIVPFRSKRVAICLRRKRAEGTNFSTWGGANFAAYFEVRTVQTVATVQNSLEHNSRCFFHCCSTMDSHAVD